MEEDNGNRGRVLPWPESNAKAEERESEREVCEALALRSYVRWVREREREGVLQWAFLVK